MARYKAMALTALELFQKWKITQISRSHNTNADALAWLRATLLAKEGRWVPIENNGSPIVGGPVVIEIIDKEGWQSPIRSYLK